jgi:hypothetical protein
LITDNKWYNVYKTFSKVSFNYRASTIHLNDKKCNIVVDKNSSNANYLPVHYDLCSVEKHLAAASIWGGVVMAT